LKELNHPLKFMVYSIRSAILHPKTQVSYHYCPACKLRFNIKEKVCPKCGDKVEHSPERKENSPIPWYGSVVVIILGIICWVLGAGLEIAGLDEVGRALVYIPMGNLFGMSLHS